MTNSAIKRDRTNTRVKRAWEFPPRSPDHVEAATEAPPRSRGRRATRRAILDRLAEGEATVSHLSRPFDLSLAAVSKHLGALERAGLVTREARGRERVCRIDPAALADARAWLECRERSWTDRLEAPEALAGTTPDSPDEPR